MPQAPGPASPVAPTEHQIDPAFLPALVDYPTAEKPGTIVIDTGARYLYLVLDGGKAQRYGVGVGREGFGWSGTVHVGRKAEWPTWTPPPAMRKRQPYLPISMPGGPNNPLGARALYLYDGGRDTLFRIHGSNEPWTIGRSVSSGCFRMRNEDVIALYERVGVGTKVVVR
jgi:lipoprotein-anchoring transpeptidase ErfK/SrfK